MESIIKWQTGEPKENGRYIVTMQGIGVTTASFIQGDEHDRYFFKKHIIAWCKLSDIEPYKEENQ